MSQKLQKNLGLAAALSTVIGMVIGGGVFFKPQAVYTLSLIHISEPTRR